MFKLRARETLAAFAERITNEYRAATSSYAVTSGCSASGSGSSSSAVGAAAAAADASAASSSTARGGGGGGDDDSRDRDRDRGASSAPATWRAIVSPIGLRIRSIRSSS